MKLAIMVVAFAAAIVVQSTVAAAVIAGVEAGPTCEGSDGTPWQCHHKDWMCCPPPCQDVCAVDDEGCKIAELVHACNSVSVADVFQVRHA